MPGQHAEDSVPDCVSSVMEDNPSYSESRAYAICQASVGGKKEKLTEYLQEKGVGNPWVNTVSKLIDLEVERSVIDDVVGKLVKGEDPMMSKSLEKVSFDAEIQTAPTIFKAGEDDFVVWGPASVEVVDKEGDKIQAKALSDALPQLLTRARLSLEHSDQLVGRILERFETDDPVEVSVGDTTYKRTSFPTDVLELDGMEPALYVAGEIFDDSRQARETRERIERGELDSYSISGEALVTRKRVGSDGEVYNDIVDLDLSAVTLCEEGMNQKAKFQPITEDGEKIASKTEKGEDPTVEDIVSIAKSTLDNTMTEKNEGQGFNLETLQSEFKSVLDDKLPDGSLATKDDVEDIAREIYRQEDDYEGDGSDSGHSEAAGRPGEEAVDDPDKAPPEGVVSEESKAEDDYEGDGSDTGTSDEHPGEEAAMDPDKAPPEGAVSEESKEDDFGKDVWSDLKEMYPALSEEEMRSLLDNAQEGTDDDPQVVEEGDYEEDYEEDKAPEDDYEDEPPAVPEDDMAPEDDVAPPDEDVGGDDMGGYSEEELEEMLPADVWEVVREYLGSGMEDNMMVEEAEEEVMMSEKEDDIEKAVEKVLSGKGFGTFGGADTPNSDQDVEKSYDEDNLDEDMEHPALTNFYN